MRKSLFLRERLAWHGLGKLISVKPQLPKSLSPSGCLLITSCMDAEGPAGSARPMYGLAPGVNRCVGRKALAAFMYEALTKVVEGPQAGIG